MHYDSAILGSGGAAYAAAIIRSGREANGHDRAGHRRRSVRQRRVHPSKARVVAAEARHIALENRFPGLRLECDGSTLVDPTAGVLGARCDPRPRRQAPPAATPMSQSPGSMAPQAFEKVKDSGDGAGEPPA